MTDEARLFRECDRRERIAMIEEAANIDRICRIIDRNFAPKEPEGGSVAFIIAAVFAGTIFTAVCLAPSEIWQLMGY